MRIPGVVHAEELANGWPRINVNGGTRWVLSRPLPFYSIWERWRVTWMVFTGRADAVLWVEQ